MTEGSEPGGSGEAGGSTKVWRNKAGRNGAEIHRSTIEIPWNPLVFHVVSHCLALNQRETTLKLIGWVVLMPHFKVGLWFCLNLPPHLWTSRNDLILTCEHMWTEQERFPPKLRPTAGRTSEDHVRRGRPWRAGDQRHWLGGSAAGSWHCLVFSLEISSFSL